MTDRTKILDEDEPLENWLRVFERSHARHRLTFREWVADRRDAAWCWITRGRR